MGVTAVDPLLGAGDPRCWPG